MTAPSSSVPPSSVPPPPGRDPMDASVGQLFGEVTKDLSTLIRQEVALAKAEATESAKKAGTGAGLLGGAVWAAHLALLFLSITVWWVLGALIGDGDREPALGWSALVVMVIWAAVAAVLGLRGKNELKKTRGLPQTAQTLKKIPDALTGQDRS